MNETEANTTTKTMEATPQNGYKKTELGWIPEDWEVVKIEDICIINPNKKDDENRDLKSVSFIGMADVSEDAKIIQLRSKQYKDVKNGFTPFRNDDVLVAKITPCFENGKGALVKNLQNNTGLGSTEFHVLRPSSNIAPEYLYFNTLTHRFRKLGETNMTGSAGQKRVPKDFIQKYKIPLPPLPQQQKIAQILSTWDRAIEKTEQLIAAKEKLKKGLMQQLLTGKVRFNEFEGEEWNEDKIENLTEFVRNGLNYGSNNYDGKPVTRIESISHGEVDFSKTSYLKKEEENSNYLIQKGDILYSHINSLEHIGKVAYFDSDEDIYHGMNLLLIRTNAKLLSEFLFYKLKGTEGKKLAKRFSKQAINQASINTKDIKSFTINYPSKLEQGKIISTIKKCNQEINIYKTELVNLFYLKKGLMNKLLIGEINMK